MREKEGLLGWSLPSVSFGEEAFSFVVGFFKVPLSHICDRVDSESSFETSSVSGSEEVHLASPCPFWWCL